MTIALFDSAIFGPLFADRRVTELFSDQSRVQAMLDVEIALAAVQAELGIIPVDAAKKIEQAAADFSPDWRSLGDGTRRAGVPVIDLLRQLRGHMDSAAARYLHWGATSQDIVDTAGVLHLRTVIDFLQTQLVALSLRLAKLADRHRHTLMSGRTRAQQALPITFGLKVAVWLMPLIRHRQRLEELKGRVLVLQFGGAVGTLAALGDRGIEVAEALARRLSLSAPAISWHTQRDSLAEFADWLALVSGSLGKIGQDVVWLSQSEIAEVAEIAQGEAGASSTMPHKSNPITSEMLITAARMNTTLLSNMHHALLAEHERAIHGWQLEWNTLPQMICCLGNALVQAISLIDNLSVDEQRMRLNLEGSHGLVLAEAATLALAKHVDRTEAESIVKAACAEVRSSGRHLLDVLQQGTSHPVPWERMRDPSGYLGQTQALIDRVLASLRQ